PDALREAVLAARGMRSHGARLRQMQYIGRLMRELDPAALLTVREGLEPGRALTARPQPFPLPPGEGEGEGPPGGRRPTRTLTHPLSQGERGWKALWQQSCKGGILLSLGRSQWCGQCSQL